MAKVKLDIIKELKTVIDKRTARKIVNQIKRDSISAMQKGLSPVKRFGRFKRYKNPRKYPGDRKAKRPVNLKLTGDLYKSLKFRFKRGNFLEYGLIRGKMKGDVDIYGPVHNDGLRKDIVQRKFIPNEPGEEFLITIQRNILKIIEDRLNRLIRKSGRT